MTMNDPASTDAGPHKPPDDREEVYYSGSPLLRGELGRFFLFALIGAVFIIGSLFLKFTFHEGMPGGLVLAMILVGAILIIWPILMLKTVTYRISNYRIDYERGLLSKSIDTLELWHVEDVSLHQSLLDRILNCGTITIITKDETTPKLRLHGLPNPRPLFDTLKQRIISVKRQRGVIKMDVG